MTVEKSPEPIKRIAFVSTRIAGTDGISLLIEKWARVIEPMGMECYYIAGECDRPPESSANIPEAHFNHPEIREITARALRALSVLESARKPGRKQGRR